jgi:hypothetical protein
MIALFPVLAAAALGAAFPGGIPADIAWVAAGEFCEPETVLPLPDDTLLVSNVCDFRERGTGFLTLLDANGKAIDWRIVSGLDAPTGMALHADRLHIVEYNRVKVFRWPGYELLDTIDLETSVANDIAVASDGTVYITDSGQHRVIELHADRSQSVLSPGSLFRDANGVAVDEENLYVGGERLWKVELASGEMTTVGPEWLADIDGIEFEADGTLQLTLVGGPLIRYRDDDDITILSGDGISSANHGYAPRLNLALIPTGFDNTVIAIRVLVNPRDSP